MYAGAVYVVELLSGNDVGGLRAAVRIFAALRPMHDEHSLISIGRR